MKPKNTLHKIKDAYQKQTPNVLDRIDLQSIEILDPPLKKRKAHVTRWVFAPIMATLFIIALLVSGLFNDTPAPPTGNDPIVVDPTPDPDPTDDPDPNDEPLPQEATLFESREQTLSAALLSATSLLTQLPPQDNAAAPALTLLSSLSQPGSIDRFQDEGEAILLDQHLGTLQRTLIMIDSFVDQSSFSTSSIEPSDIDHFSYQITFQQLNLQGVNVAYVFHFNETRVGQDIMLEGIMIKGQEHYRLEGELHITSEGFELELLAEHPTQKDTYVEIEQIVSLDEHTLEFSLVKQGDTIQETLLSLEFDDDMVTVSFEIEFETLEISFEIEFRQNQSERLFFIEFDIDNDNDDDDGVIVASTRLNPEDGLLYFRFDIETDEGEFVRYRVIQSSSLTPTHQALMPEKSNPLLST